MNGSTQKVRMLVFFGDISGFTDFDDSVTNDEIEYNPFMAEYDDLIDKIERETGYAFKNTGDGFLCTIDLLPGHNCTLVIKALLVLWKLLKKIERLILEKDPPKPDGFRIVGAAGYVRRKVKKDGEIILRGRPLNHAHNALDQARGKGIVCDDILKQLISDRQAKQHGLKFTSMGNRLWILKVGKHHK